MFLIQINKDKPDNLDWDLLDNTDAIIFGVPTYMGSLARSFKIFMEATSTRWAQQQWQDKISAAFTNSTSYAGDKLCSIQQLFHFAIAALYDLGRAS
ncbi:transcriptional regulator [Rickettsia conorii subsp. heilongjiangensis]|uniref:Transcriptional regulator n=1 Tax=Rickettsia conorii subsp. heilongjiangensis TaxID=226665 RepID=A0AAD1GJA6_RICCR|nr:flavodoxin family protein [Rickettsia conorii]BBM91649.1 transcriptional regulator [Rickettsia conorii subsp. heilongjiangensis]BBM92857.1 transcriptional regulator [Rickettsia conorii subsp. heilongjiangensis]BBM94066.1 transcriptional regulator [Rickettsia conorii subsp. heilongjiangensis]BBM95275.1 transcriptional regulator [Rickettsia conorii subsp. heilongjiangensis]